MLHSTFYNKWNEHTQLCEVCIWFLNKMFQNPYLYSLINIFFSIKEPNLFVSYLIKNTFTIRTRF